MGQSPAIIRAPDDFRVETWKERTPFLLFNTQLNPVDQKAVQYIFDIKSKSEGVFVSSSGSSKKSNESVRLYGFSHEAFEVSAAAVNRHLQATSQDRWSLALPVYHVGGFAILIRAMLSQSQVFVHLNDKWSAQELKNNLEKDRITLLSLVPTQLYDLVREKIKPPPALRAVVIGGAALSFDLYLQARELGWPVLPSYGMTECCSQIATADIDLKNSLLKVLDHCEVRLTIKHLLEVKSSSLFKVKYFMRDGVIIEEKPSENGWYATEDFVTIRDGYITQVSRESDFVKIKGVGVNLALLREELTMFFLQHNLSDSIFALKARVNERSGHELTLYLQRSSELSEPQIQSLLEKFHEHRPHWEKMEKIFWIDKIPRSALGKILYSEL